MALGWSAANANGSRVLQVANIIFQVTSIRHSEKDAVASKPDFSSDHARAVFVLFMPGVSPGLLLFIVFGLTRTYREYMYTVVVPKRWQRPLSDPERPEQGSSQLHSRSTQNRGEESMPTSNGMYTPGKGILLENSAVVVSTHVLSGDVPVESNDELRLLHKPQYRTTVQITAG